VALPE